MKFFIMILSIPFYIYYSIKGIILVLMKPEDGRSSEEIVHDMITKDREKINKIIKERQNRREK